MLHNRMESKIFKMDFLKILKNSLRIYLLLRFQSNLLKIFRKCYFRYYKQLVRKRFLKKNLNNLYYKI